MAPRDDEQSPPGLCPHGCDRMRKADPPRSRNLLLQWAGARGKAPAPAVSRELRGCAAPLHLLTHSRLSPKEISPALRLS